MNLRFSRNRVPIKTLIDINIIIYRINIQISGRNLFCRSLRMLSDTLSEYYVSCRREIFTFTFLRCETLYKESLLHLINTNALSQKISKVIFPRRCIYSNFSARNEFSVFDEFKLVARCRGIFLSRKHPWIHERSPLHFIITFLANGIRWIMSCRPRLEAEIA